jgi:hypothetical protein
MKDVHKQDCEQTLQHTLSMFLRLRLAAVSSIKAAKAHRLYFLNRELSSWIDEQDLPPL